MCSSVEKKLNPEIVFDHDLIRLRNNATDPHRKEPHFIMFMRELKNCSKGCPPFQFVDTIAMKNGHPEFAMYFDEKVKVIYNFSLKGFLLGRKELLDLQYQKKKYLRERTGFSFAQFDHESEKLIK